jgi:hypothetical protein
MKKFKCNRCGKCCLTIPCIFAQVRHGIDSSSPKPCPDLVKTKTGYKCKMISKDKEMQIVLLDGSCDDPKLADKKPKFSAQEEVRKIFPKISKAEIEFIVWEKTGYPLFFRKPEDGWTDLQCFRKQVMEYKDEIQPTQTN